jgi:hypothetical protein
MGLIPLLIIYNNAWKPLLREFRAYVETSPIWGGSQMQAGMQPAGMLPPGMQQPGMGMQQPGMQQPGMQQPSMQQPGMQQPGMQQPGMQQPGMQQPGMQQPGMEQGAPGHNPQLAGTMLMPQAPPIGGQWPGQGGQQ